MGFKRDFHEASIELGSRLIGKIREMNPEILVTDCLSCRLQFNQLLPLHGAPSGRNSQGGIQGRGAGCTAQGARVKTILGISRRVTAYALQDEAGADKRFTWFKCEINFEVLQMELKPMSEFKSCCCAPKAASSEETAATTKKIKRD